MNMYSQQLNPNRIRNLLKSFYFNLKHLTHFELALIYQVLPNIYKFAE
jgi:hypothetical protein